MNLSGYGVNSWMNSGMMWSRLAIQLLTDWEVALLRVQIIFQVPIPQFWQFVRPQSVSLYKVHDVNYCLAQLLDSSAVLQLTNLLF